MPIKKVLKEINTIYHAHKGVDGYRSMRVCLEQRGYSLPTLHKYINSELGLKSIVRRKGPGCPYGKPHKTFENKLKQNFHADSINQKWCTDFTYLFLRNGDIRYNRSIIDLYDRSIVASITDRRITSEPAIRTLQKALDHSRNGKEN